MHTGMYIFNKDFYLFIKGVHILIAYKFIGKPDKTLYSFPFWNETYTPCTQLSILKMCKGCILWQNNFFYHVIYIFGILSVKLFVCTYCIKIGILISFISTFLKKKLTTTLKYFHIKFAIVITITLWFSVSLYQLFIGLVI